MTSAHHPKQEMIAILSGNRIFLYNYESITRKILKFNTSFNLGQGLISIGNYNFATFFDKMKILKDEMLSYEYWNIYDKAKSQTEYLMRTYMNFSSPLLSHPYTLLFSKKQILRMNQFFRDFCPVENPIQDALNILFQEIFILDFVQESIRKAFELNNSSLINDPGKTYHLIELSDTFLGHNIETGFIPFVVDKNDTPKLSLNEISSLRQSNIEQIHSVISDVENKCKLFQYWIVNGIEDLVFLEIAQVLIKEIPIKHCAKCEKIFIADKYSKTYCDSVECKNSANQKYRERIKNDIYLKDACKFKCRMAQRRYRYDVQYDKHTKFPISDDDYQKWLDFYKFERKNYIKLRDKINTTFDMDHSEIINDAGNKFLSKLQEKESELLKAHGDSNL